MYVRNKAFIFTPDHKQNKSYYLLTQPKQYPMARPLKKGLAYFPLDTDLFGDRKMQRLLMQHGPQGLAVYLAALTEIYRSNGYFLPFYEEFYFDLSFTLKAHEKQVKKIILFCLEINLFDRNMLKDKGILTSRGIQKRFLEVNKRAKNEIITSCFLLKDKTEVFAAKTGGIVTESPLIVTKTPTKGKGNKKENKEEKNKSKKKNDEINQSTETNYAHQPENENTESARRAQLLQMAAEATANKRDA